MKLKRYDFSTNLKSFYLENQAFHIITFNSHYCACMSI